MKAGEVSKKQLNEKHLDIKYCTSCNCELTIENCKEYNLKHSKYICENCLYKRNQKRYKDNRDKRLKQYKNYEKKNKEKILEAYGSKCVCCGEDTPEFLTIDHIDNNVAEIRKQTKQGTGVKLHRWLIKNNFPQDNYQLLCFNCNYAKEFFGKCPHQKT